MPVMNSKERVLATFQGEPVDRRPFTAMLSLYGAGLINCPLSQYYTDPLYYAKGQAAVRETFQSDILFAPLVAVAEGEAFGSEAKYFDDMPPNLFRPVAPSPDDIAGLSLPDINSHPRLVFIREALRRITEEHGQEICIGALALGPVDLPFMIMSMDGWLETILFKRDNARRMLELTIPFFINWVNALFRDGASFVLIPTASLNPWIASREMAEEFTIPTMREVLPNARGKIILHHTGEAFPSFWEMCRDLPNVIGLIVDSINDYKKIRQNVGVQTTILAGFDGLKIGSMQPEKIEKECRELLCEFKKDPRIIPGASVLDVSLDIPSENILAIKKAIENMNKSLIPKQPDTVCIACSVFYRELQALQERGLLELETRFLDSNLHLTPAKLHTQMSPILDSELEKGNRVLLLYGDCHTHIVKWEKHHGICRTRGSNCAEIFLGRECYRELIKDGAFFLFPEWVLRWKEIFDMLLGLDLDGSAEVIRDMHSKLVYLDTGVMPLPETTLKECSEYCDLPYQVKQVSLDHFLDIIKCALEVD